MNKLESALGGQFTKNKNAVRTRSFVLGGHTFKVKIPLTKEFEEIKIRMELVDNDIVESYYKEMIKDLKESDNCKITDDDVVVSGQSMREASKNKHVLEQRVTEMFKLLVPEESEFDMANINYKMIDELFPLPIQLKVMENISNVVSPTYEEAKGK